MRDGSEIPDDVLRDDGIDAPFETMPLSGLLYYRERYRRHAELFDQIDREIARRERAGCGRVRRRWKL